jgi:hypothetical protein
MFDSGLLNSAKGFRLDNHLRNVRRARDFCLG